MRLRSHLVFACAGSSHHRRHGRHCLRRPAGHVAHGRGDTRCSSGGRVRSKSRACITHSASFQIATSAPLLLIILCSPESAEGMNQSVAPLSLIWASRGEILSRSTHTLKQACFLCTFEKTQDQKKLNVLAFGQKLKDFFSKNSKL